MIIHALAILSGIITMIGLSTMVDKTSIGTLLFLTTPILMIIVLEVSRFLARRKKDTEGGGQSSYTITKK